VESEGSETEKSGKSWWNPEQLDRHPASRWCSCITGQALRPPEAPMGALGTRKELLCGHSLQMTWRVHLHINALMAQELYPGAPMISARPISPDERQASWLDTIPNVVVRRVTRPDIPNAVGKNLEGDFWIIVPT